MVIPCKTFFLLITSFLSITSGMVTNFVVIKENQGRMPVYSRYNFENVEHFSIKDVSEIKQLQFADIYHFMGGVWSIGDFLMIFGYFLLICATIIMAYNLFLNMIIKRRNK